MIGYKAFKKDKNGIYTDGLGNNKKIYWKIGDRKKIDGQLKLCKNGFHFFEHLCFAINYLEQDNVIYEIIAHGNIEKDAFKLCTDDIEILKKISKKEINSIINNNDNSGKYNSGDYNTGDYNSGNGNAGNRNTGNRNAGNYNSGSCNTGKYNSGSCNAGHYNTGSCNAGNDNAGNYNSGRYNTGNRNAGHRNTGNRNAGHHNTGNYNSGDYNAGSYNSGNGYLNFFCTKTKYFLFDIEINDIPKELKNLNMNWFDLDNKTYKEAWANCPKKILNILKHIPEFNIKENKIKFKEITGIDL